MPKKKNMVHFSLNEKIYNELTSICKSLGLSRTSLLTALVLFIIFISQQGNIVGNIQNLALANKKPFEDALLEFLKGRF